MRRLTLAICRLLLALSPRAFRKRFSAELLDDADRHLQGQSGAAASGPGLVSAALILDTGRAVLAERRGARTGWLTDVGGDVRQVARSWSRAPGFTVTMILTLI